jgi:hypothetical protein
LLSWRFRHLQSNWTSILQTVQMATLRCLCYCTALFIWGVLVSFFWLLKSYSALKVTSCLLLENSSDPLNQLPRAHCHCLCKTPGSFCPLLC